MKKRGTIRFVSLGAPARFHYSNTAKIVLGSIFAAVAAILQSAGIFVGFGYAFSILATLPIFLSTYMSIKTGIMSFVITCILLGLIQPSELMVFPLTTGLLGICLGIAFHWWKNWLMISIFGGIGLATGILFLLYIFRFPVLGPSISPQYFELKTIIFVLIFSLFYSWVWMGLGGRISRLVFRAKKFGK